MHEGLIIFGEILASIISVVTIAKFLFYTKSQVDTMIKNSEESTNSQLQLLATKIEANHTSLAKELVETKEQIFKSLLEAERANNKERKEIYDRLTQNKESFEDYNKSMLETISQIKQEDKDLSAQFMQLLNSVKDELKNDYINRYNELLQIMNTKVNATDFDRLEHKFDKVCETITELKTIVTIQQEEHKKK